MFEIPVNHRCPFCDYLSGKAPCAFVTRERGVSVFMNRAQYEKGAALLVPNRHVESILDLDRELMAELLEEAQRIAGAMIRAFGAVGLNLFQNNGVRAGQSISHYHLHLVPRYADSEPARIFREEDYPHASFDVLRERAEALGAALPTSARVVRPTSLPRASRADNLVSPSPPSRLRPRRRGSRPS